MAGGGRKALAAALQAGGATWAGSLAAAAAGESQQQAAPPPASAATHHPLTLPRPLFLNQVEAWPGAEGVTGSVASPFPCLSPACVCAVCEIDRKVGRAPRPAAEA